LLEGKAPIEELQFEPDPDGVFEGVLDLFEDGSVFAIRSAGHTAGSLAFLIRTTNGPVLLTGDTCHTRWGWENLVEPGAFTRDTERNGKNLRALKNLVERHPKIIVKLGHQP
jgi:glyoxylase-like metal-dependent hydrolase (beta-lactamase superfamily II)